MDEQAFSFGGELRRRRTRNGISLAQLAGLVHYSKSHLSKVETGVKAPSSDLARLCDAALAADGELVALVSAPAAPSTTPEPGVTSEELFMNLGVDGNNRIGIVRRELLAAGVSVAVMWMLPRPAIATRFNDDTLESFRSMLRGMRRLGQTVSPSTLAPMVVTHTHALASMATQADRTMRNGLFGLAAHFATYAGWMAQESGDNAAALDWTERAAAFATAAGNADLAAYTLVRRALIALNCSDALGAIALAERAEATATSRRVRGLAAQRAAQGHAVAGNGRECQVALDRAAALLDAAEPDDGDAVIGTSNVGDPAAMVTGWCLHDLGRPREAAEILERELARIPLAAGRARARFGTRLGLALASQRELDQACAVLEPVLAVVADTDSATIRLDLGRVAATLNRWHNEPAVRDIQPRLMAALHIGRS